MDSDLAGLTREQLVAEVQRLRDGSPEAPGRHRTRTLLAPPELWCLLPEATDPLPTVPDWPQFLQGCIRYRQSLDVQAPTAPRTAKPFEDHPG